MTTQSPADITINGKTMHKLVQAGLTWLRANQQEINALNVFPVPDGDTGTNMVLTMQSAVDELSEIESELNAGKVMAAVAQGALMGARGNSGVILSQIWRGVSRAMEDTPILDGPTLVKAFAEARDTAYKGVVRPVEGTILTVAKDCATAAALALEETEHPVEILERVVAAAEISVEHTPELLPVLKEAGVVDSGGKGLYYILEGMLRWTQGLPLDEAVNMVQPLALMEIENTLESIEEGQDYEVIVDFTPYQELDLESFYAELETMGTSIQVGEGDNLYRMHIHVPAENLYNPITYTLTLGDVTNAYIENLMLQLNARKGEAEEAPYKLVPVEPGQVAVVAVAPGDGFARIFASLGVAAIVPGGQTMNPSTQDILAAFEDLPSDQIIILPNNKNIQMAAQAAAEVSVKKVHVIPSRTIPQGLAALMRLMPDSDLDEVVAEMGAGLAEVETGEITTATRDVEIDDVQVQKDQIIALHNGKLILSSPSLEAACLGFLEQVGMDDFELVTLFRGQNVSDEEVQAITEKIETAYPDHELEIQAGGQPHYQFIFAIE